MNWTPRDSAYLSVIVVLLVVLGVFLLQEVVSKSQRVAPASAGVPRSATVRALSEAQATLEDDVPELRIASSQTETVEHVRTIEITPEMTPEELAKALNMRVEDLPARYRKK